MRIAFSKLCVVRPARSFAARLVAGLALAGAFLATPAFEAEAQPSAALPAMSLSAVTTGPARPIAAWAEFCERYSGECAVDRTEAASITLTSALWQTINAVNRRINRAVEAVTDQDHWRAADRWDLAEDGRGDCEDFQLLKRRLLVEAGLPRRAMRMTVVIDEKGEGHAVLTLITNRGDLILDNKTSAVLPWTQTGYTFVKRESQEAVGWVALGRDASPLTAANR
ncbi:transglutaminase-like cysteine peptidase [Methylobacterium sp. R2-1]|uniref:transglutaminase-like cysteine peptidase n=1 Tax=Methylobacterium sp. R2-1 TaxID=2587064 RepID=UPI00161FBCB7|nr:transglutaminase-like cysteine peptidase [Methylobacterium sp. R2-1]MBB2960178.1 putative transglutaminase-like cysteine proteinase [Methylobacterium sp. R2-1]